MKNLITTLALITSSLLSIPAHAVIEVQATQLSQVLGTGKLEGAVSDTAGNFYFCNMNTEGLEIKKNGTIGVIPAGESEAQLFLTLPEGIRGNGLRIGPDGNLYMADQLGGNLVRINIETKAVDVLWHIGIDNPKWNQSANDVAITPDGKHLYVSCVREGVYRMNLDGSDATKVLDKNANGIEVSPDGTRLIISSGIYSIEEDGTLKSTGIKLQLPKEGYRYTDGLRCDVEGNIYVSRAAAKGGTAAVHVFDPEGNHIKNIKVDFRAVHNICFGGPDGKTLFLVCPGKKGFIASYQNDIHGRNLADLARWGL